MLRRVFYALGTICFAIALIASGVWVWQLGGPVVLGMGDPELSYMEFAAADGDIICGWADYKCGCPHGDDPADGWIDAGPVYRWPRGRFHADEGRWTASSARASIFQAVVVFAMPAVPALRTRIRPRARSPKHSLAREIQMLRRRQRRRRIRFVAALLLPAAALLCWVRSCEGKDRLWFDATPNLAIDVITCDGIVYSELNWSHSGPIDPQAPGIFLVREWESFYDQYPTDLSDFFDPCPWRLDLNSSGGWFSIHVGIPFWFLFLLGLAGLVIASVRRMRRAYRAHTGCCPECGYDLRASPDRCPECGTPHPAIGDADTSSTGSRTELPRGIARL